MKVLLINTCGDVGTVALGDETGVVAEDRLPARGTSEAVMPAVRRVFAAAELAPGELGAVGVVNGPGSFTGVRVGLSVAKGLCEGLGVGMVAMSRLGLVAGAVGRRVAVLDAGRGEFFFGAYEGGVMVREGLGSEAEVRELGGGAVTCEERVAERLGVQLVAEPDAETMLAEVLRRISRGEWSDVAKVDANYLRRTDAELLKAKNKG